MNATRTCALLLAVLAGGAASASTMEEADALFKAKKFTEAAAAYAEIAAREPTNALALLRQARASAAAGDDSKALQAIRAWVATGNASYSTAMAVPEFESLRSDPQFLSLVEPLKPCTSAEYRQFDFWQGDWDVRTSATDTTGPAGHNVISAINDGCALLEQYQASSVGFAGKSLSFYDAARKAWHQTWMDNQGQPLYLEGGLRDGSMVMTTAFLSRAPDPQDFQRVTWTPLPQGRVRQLWESTTDGGKTWTTIFEGYYTPRPRQ